jgi:hypothetical protein
MTVVYRVKDENYWRVARTRFALGQSLARAFRRLSKLSWPLSVGKMAQA